LDADGNPLINTTMNITFDGKTYSGNTTEEGLFPIKLNEIAIGNHVLEIINPATTQKLNVSVKVVSRFSGNKNINMFYYDGSSYKVRIVGDNGQFVGKNKVVVIKIGKYTYNVKTDANGYATLKIPYAITPAKYTITATYAGQTVKNTLTVKQVLKTVKTVKVKQTANKLVLRAILKQGTVALKNKVIRFKLNGKTFSAKTDSKGIAKVTIGKSFIKKLKVKQYSIKATYINDAVNFNLKVVR
jgi:hypothetical protein